MSDRQTGWTTRQMTAAPIGAWYIWPFEVSLRYAKDLACRLGREDLVIGTRTMLDVRRARGRPISAVILDHATCQHMTDDQWLSYKIIVRNNVRP
jgi:hypothetical protein